ncbi:U-box domain-containing protein 35-like [Silene latifolia]|uniref:U-box domain-containing protein 35-like n=1 Tax=Silene latifolia TaxID=37657 RepID=UPI003D77A9C9
METEESGVPQHVVAVALTGSRKSKYILKWALDQFLPEGNVRFKILHVYPKITVIPTPMGTWVPVAEVREDLVCSYKQETEWKKKKRLLPYKKALEAQKIESEIVVIESDDVAMTLCLEIERHYIRHLVIGCSSTSAWKYLSLTKMLTNQNLPAVISDNAPSFCSIYVVADGKLQTLRPSESKPTVISVHNTSDYSSDSFTDNSSSSSLTLGEFSNNITVTTLPIASGAPHTKELGNLGNPGQGSYTSTNNYKPEPSESYPNSMSAQKRIRESKEATHYSYQGTNKSLGNNTGVNHSYNSGDSGSWASDGTSPAGSFAGTPPTGSSVSIPYGGSFTGTPPTGSSVSIPTGGSFTGTPPTGSPMSIPMGGSFAGTPPAGSYVGKSAAVSFVGGSFTGAPPIGSSVSIPMGSSQHAGSYVGTPPVSFVGTPPGSFMATRPSSPATSEDQVDHPITIFFVERLQAYYVSTALPMSSHNLQVYELEKLRMELRHVEKMYELAQNNDMNEKLFFPIDQLNTLSKELEAALKLQEGKVKEITSTEKNKHKAGETKAAEKTEDENKRQQLLASPITQCQKFNWNELMEATSNLSEEFKIGSGAFGTVYKCKLHHTTAAVKVLHSKDTVTNKQFLQELEILSTIRHPHILLLLGAVPEKSCLVYEYMENGSLDDRLFRKSNIPPLPWYERVRICWEVASALAFLHSTKPKPIIHRDLKPANILLDQHLVSKIGDAGLGTTINAEPNDQSLRTLYKETSPVGTLCYIDPEYQRTGRVSTKSDVYALGIVILQLLTAKPAVGISYLIEDAIEEGTLTEVLDQEAGTWAEDVALELATLGLKCSELRGKDRPDLREIVLSTLERLKEGADSAREKAANAPAALPTHFICPISKDIMEDPYIAADGYTYDRVAIEQWLAENTASPTTSLPLPHKFIMPNYTLLEAIKQWKSKQQP